MALRMPPLRRGLSARLLVLTVGFVVVNFIADLLHGVLDPRIRIAGRPT